MENITTISDEDFELELLRRKAAKLTLERQERHAYQSLKIEMVEKAVSGALVIEKSIRDFRHETINAMFAFRDLMDKYGETPKNSKGGYSLKIDDTVKLALKLRTIGEFDELADLAEQHIREFFEKTLREKDVNAFDMMMKLLKKDKGGRLQYSRVLEILSFENRFEDDNFKKGCELFKESYGIAGTKYYIEIEVRDGDGVWRKLDMNMSRLGNDNG